MPPRPKKPSSKTASKLLGVVQFLSLITKDEGSPQDTHILLSNHTATAFNGTIGAGAVIDEDLHAAPHAKTFLSALQKCGETYTLTQVDQSRLSIKSGPFKANIPCIDPTLLYIPTPDSNVASLNDEFKTAIQLIEKVKPENGQRVVTLSFLLNGQSILSTDGRILVEAWHGLDLPVGIPVPKAVIPALLINKKLSGFGISSSTVTFYFDDNSFVRSQLYAEGWPDISAILNKQAAYKAVPENFFTALEAVANFSPNGFVYFKDGKLQSNEVEDAGATFEITELQKGPVYSIKYLLMLKDMAEKIDFYVPAERKSLMCAFVGGKCRGILMGYG